MSTSKEVVQQILDALVPLDVRARPMFGSYGVWCDEKFVAILSGTDLYIKRSGAALYLFEGTEPAPPFPGARHWHRVPPYLLGDDAWLRDAIRETALALPAPKPKRRGVASGSVADSFDPTDLA